MPTDDPPLGYESALIWQERLQKLPLFTGGGRVVGEMHLDRAYKHVGDEGDERRQRTSDRGELGRCLVQGANLATNLQDELTRQLLASLDRPACERPNSHAGQFEARD